jgi:hypothetical protein
MKRKFILTAAMAGVFSTLAAQTAPAPAAPTAAPAADSATAADNNPAPARPARPARGAPGPQPIGGIQAISTTSSYKFFFGTGDAPAGYTKVSSDMAYNDTRGYGFDGGTSATIVSKQVAGQPDVNLATADKQFYFSTALPEGNYKVTVTMGNPDVATDVSVKAESRRLMLENVQTKPGEYVTKTIIVNIRTPKYPGGVVNLKATRETQQEAWDWDNGLTLEFNGDHPSISDLRIEKVDVPTVFVIGDSTSCDQSSEPYNSWGQTITRFFKPEVAVANHGESGETVGDCLGRHRFDKIWSLMKPGDYLFVTSGHNERNGKNSDMTFDQRFYDDCKQVVDETRAHGGIPVLVTPISRAPGSASLGPYPGELRQLATDEKVAFIDLNGPTAILYKAMPDYHVAFASRNEATHTGNYGSYEVSKILIAGIKQNNLPLAQSIVDDFKELDPAHPDAFDSYKVAPTPRKSAANAAAAVPDGR